MFIYVFFYLILFLSFVCLPFASAVRRPPSASALYRVPIFRQRLQYFPARKGLEQLAFHTSSHDVSKEEYNGKTTRCSSIENRLLCVFRDCFVVYFDDFCSCHRCKPRRHFFPSCSEVNSKRYSEFE